MFKDLLSKFHLWKEQRKYQRTIDLNAKKFYIKLALIQYYNDLDRIYDVVDIPAHIRADRYLTGIKPAKIDKLYRKFGKKLRNQEAIC